MKKVIKKLAVYMVLGMIFGFFMATLRENRELTIDYSGLTAPFIIFLLILVLALSTFSVLSYMRIRKFATQTFEGDEEDEMQEKMYRLSSDANLATTLTLIVSMTGMSVAILTETLILSALIFVVFLVLGTLLTYFSADLMNKLYPERNLPAVSDKNYADKLLELSDDGERHVMLGGLFKSYQTANFLMFLAILFLVVYSLATADSQMVGILVIAGILIATNMRYTLSIRNK